jgi:hypothetical protein
MGWENFTLQFEMSRSTGPVKVVRSAAGEGRDDLGLSFEEIEALLARGVAWDGSPGRPQRDLAPPPTAEVAPQRVGGMLHQALFSGRTGELWNRALGMAGARQNGVRLELVFALDEPRLVPLARLPWELLYDEREGGFLFRGNRDRLLTRSFEVGRPASPLAVRLPLRVLIALATPGGLPALEVEGEWGRIERAWAGRADVALTCLRHASLEGLRQELLARRHQVVHFVGHGAWEPTSGEGALALEDTRGNCRFATGPVLAEHMGDLKVRLVVLNACNTASLPDAPSASPFAGAATSLVARGLPAVVAMQRPISDRSALLWSEVFYCRLAADDPLDVALAEARLALSTGGEQELDWATPVLYLRSRGARLFKVRPGGAARPAPAPPPPAAAPSAANPLPTGRFWVDPPRDDVLFEQLSLAVLKRLLGDPLAQLNGRPGQRQDGIDAFGILEGRSQQVVGLQAKALTRSLTEQDLMGIVQRATSFDPKLTQLIVATTSRRDATLQQSARAYPNDSVPFSVRILSWDDILAELQIHSDLASRYLGIPNPALLWLRRPVAPLRRSPSALLRPESEVVPFTGRTAEIEDLLAWTQADGGPAVRLVAAPGGAGKTRLAIELCHQLERIGVNAGFLSTDQFVACKSFMLQQPLIPFLCIVDYAETCLDELRALFGDLGGALRHQRFLLLSRPQGDWWNEIVEQLRIRSIPVAEEPLGLKPIARTITARQETFLLVQTAFADALELVAPPGLPDLSQPDLGGALALHCRALMRLYDEDAKNMHGLLKGVWSHEQNYVRAQLKRYGLDDLRLGVGRAVTLISEAGGATDDDDAIELLRLLPFFADQCNAYLEGFATALHDCYGGTQWIDRLMPDQFREYLMVATFKNHFDEMNNAIRRLDREHNDAANT